MKDQKIKQILTIAVVLSGGVLLSSCAAIKDMELPGVPFFGQDKGMKESKEMAKEMPKADPMAELKALRNIRVRVGLYSRAGRDVATGIRSELRNSGYDAHIKRISQDSFGLYVGRDLSAEEAVQTKSRLDARLGVSTLIVGDAADEATN